MLTSEQAQYLIEIPKKIVEKDILLDSKNILCKRPFSERYYLLAENDDEVSFFLETNQSTKKSLKFTLHYQEDESNHGILRIDYCGRHKNPEKINEYVPNKFRAYAGLYLDEPGHIHYTVYGYRDLAWAIPLEADSFPVKRISSNEDIAEAFKGFCSTINLQTKIHITPDWELF